MVEHLLAKEGVGSSNLLFRSNIRSGKLVYQTTERRHLAPVRITTLGHHFVIPSPLGEGHFTFKDLATFTSTLGRIPL